MGVGVMSLALLSFEPACEALRWLLRYDICLSLVCSLYALYMSVAFGLRLRVGASEIPVEVTSSDPVQMWIVE